MSSGISSAQDLILRTDRQRRRVLFLTLVVLSVACCSRLSYAYQGDFDLSKSRIDTKDLLSGGPGKDGIPALSNPRFVPASQARHVTDNDLVAGISLLGQDRAYPLRILNFHEIVNDSVSGVPVAVTWCPLTQSAIVFDRRIDNEVLEFGVSGLLYNSNLVMYDRNHSCLWPQLQAGAVTGKLSSKRLEVIPSLVTTWREWRRTHPDTLVLSQNTGFPIDYGYEPYLGYQSSQQLMFPVKKLDRRLPPKSLVIGVRIENVAKAYPIQLVTSQGSPLEDIVAGVNITVYPGFGNTAYVKDAEGNLIPAIIAYWFAWSAFNKDTLIYTE